jgi:hypothetical protein
MASLLLPARAVLRAAGTTASGLRIVGRGIRRPGAYGGPGFSARVILDSVSPAGARITTMEWRYPRFIHAEIMTYRMFSRNSASSRAIPVQKLLEQVILNPAGPVWWGRAQAGMQAHEQLTGWRRTLAQDLWYGGRYAACAEALINHRLGLHKQVTNRGIEKWMWITARVSYLTHEGIRDYKEDLKLYRRLHLDGSDEAIPHTSPAEHVLTANEDATHRSGNVFGWDQHREEVDPYFIHYFEDEAA